MEIIVEIGTAEQKELIKQELEIIKTVCSNLTPPTQVICIIVPENFDNKVNEIQNTIHYKSTRENHRAVAKTIITVRGIYLVFSGLLYTETYDNLKRLQFYLHELIHAINKQRFPALEKNVHSVKTYLLNLYILFDEYYANRKSFEIVDNLFPQTSTKHKHGNRTELKLLIKPLIADSKHYDKIKLEIGKFRVHGQINQFLNNTECNFDEVSKAIVHSYSYIDHYPKFKRFERFLLKSRFVNNKTLNLLNYYRKKFNENNTDLSDGVNLMICFMENFGIRFEDTTQGIYCHVIDI
ncbi:MAG: hypothetical protein PHO70_01515 [Candidatus Omnitrophica bacterium]|nr:hypothetical protein [Candidatus Omnitrophota bacterium]